MDTKPKSTPTRILEQQLAAKKAWRKKRAALPIVEKLKVLEKLRAQNRVFRAIRKTRSG
jgi:hypothetical protein